MEVKISKQQAEQVLSAQYFKDIYRYKDLLYMLIKRDISVIYKQTVMGFAWAIFRPLVQMVVFTVFFGKLLGVGQKIDGGVPYALFSYAALVPWTYFASTLNGSTGSLVSNAQFLTKVYFPRLIIPIVPLIAKMVDFLIAFTILVIMLAFYGLTPGIEILFLPVLLVIMVLSAFGISLWLSALAIQYRDVQQLMMFLAQLLMYAAPVIWPMNIIPQEYQLWYGLYPMVGVIEGFRAILLGSGPVPYHLIGMGAITTAIVLLTGLVYFRRNEDKFADVS